MKGHYEKWKPIKGYEGIYEVSNIGRVRTYRTKDGWVGFKLTEQPRLMSTVSHGNGYLYVTLVKDGEKHNKYVHRLVAEAFIGEIPKGMVINHLDHNKGNNRVENLEITTQQLNILYSQEKMCKPKGKGDDRYICYREKHNTYEVAVNRKYLGCYKTIEEARKVRDAYIKEINYY